MRQFINVLCKNRGINAIIMGRKNVVIIKKAYIEKFRAINDLTLPLGNKITAIAGQNGVMKTTILGILGQPFSMTDENSPLTKALTIEGTKFESKFRNKFKLSYPEYDKVGEHLWRLYFHDNDIYPKEYIEITSINRLEPSKNIDYLRFWSTEGREAGMGYVQCPLIYLSLKRLTPIGEEKLKKAEIELTTEERAFFIKYHQDILVINDNNIMPEYIVSANKKTLGAKTPNYDALTNSAGQDNVGKILLSIISFYRLKKEYPNDYKGGILLIDELESTLFPAAQEKLLKALIKFSRKLQLQIIFTTHSLRILKLVSEYPKDSNDLKLLYLVKQGDQIKMFENPDYDAMENDINIMVKDVPRTQKKITVYCEDVEAQAIFNALIPAKLKKHICIAKEPLGCDNLKSLANRGVKEFTNNIIVLDGDTRLPRHKNFMILPGNQRPENLLFDYLKNLPEENEIWDAFGEGGYTKQFCFKNYNQLNDRDSAKNWFGSQRPYWGRNLSRVMKPWKRDNQNLVNMFIDNFIAIFNLFAPKHGIDKIN